MQIASAAIGLSIKAERTIATLEEKRLCFHPAGAPGVPNLLLSRRHAVESTAVPPAHGIFGTPEACNAG